MISDLEWFTISRGEKKAKIFMVEDIINNRNFWSVVKSIVDSLDLTREFGGIGRNK